jgi:Protein of unknown function (DUF4238)
VKQHWVPGSYLQAWTDPDCSAGHKPCIHLFDRQGGSYRAKSPANVFHMLDLYTIGSGTAEDLNLEWHFSRIPPASAAFSI